jgi:undecaprenyl-diphosphatase
MDFMTAIVLGVVQGLAEFLPISSTAHVQIVAQLMHVSLTKPQLTAFIATIQLGTEAAVLIYFFKDIVRIVSAWFRGLFNKDARSADYRMGWLVIIGSLPVVIIGLALQKYIETSLRNLQVIAISLIVFGLILGIADRMGAKDKQIDQLTFKHGIWFGIGQALAVIPGVSRSGGTISVGLALGYTRAAAARYSFLLAVPAVLASGIYEFLKSYKDLGSSVSIAATGVSTVVSFVVGLAVIAGLLKYLSKGSFWPFVLWRVGVGVAVLVLLSNGVLTA